MNEWVGNLTWLEIGCVWAGISVVLGLIVGRIMGHCAKADEDMER